MTVRRLITLRRSAVIGVILMVTSYVLLFAEWTAMKRRVASSTNCPGEPASVPEIERIPDIGSGLLPPHVTCQSLSGDVHRYWLGISSSVFLIGLILIVLYIVVTIFRHRNR